MRASKKKPTAEKLRSWRVALMRSRTHYLGVVYAPDEKAAEAAAIAEFKIGDEQRRALQGIATAPRGISSNVRPR
jgi:hypothetical protein